MGKSVSSAHKEAGTNTHTLNKETGRWERTAGSKETANQNELLKAGLINKEGNLSESLKDKINKITEPTYGIATYRGIKEKRYDIKEDTLSKLNNKQKEELKTILREKRNTVDKSQKKQEEYGYKKEYVDHWNNQIKSEKKTLKDFEDKKDTWGINHSKGKIRDYTSRKNTLTKEISKYENTKKYIDKQLSIIEKY
jgi:hypothetical protein